MENSRIFDIDGVKFRFDRGTFCKLFDKTVKKRNVTVKQLEDILAGKAYVSRDAVHNWRLGRNGPGDVNTVGQIAEALGCDIFALLEKNDHSTKPLTGRQISAFKRIYDEFELVLMGFETEYNVSREFEQIGETVNLDEYKIHVCGLFNKLTLRLILEYFDLRNSQLYCDVADLWKELMSKYSELENEAFNTHEGEEEPDATCGKLVMLTESALALAKETDLKLALLIDKYYV